MGYGGSHHDRMGSRVERGAGLLRGVDAALGNNGYAGYVGDQLRQQIQIWAAGPGSLAGVSGQRRADEVDAGVPGCERVIE